MRLRVQSILQERQERGDADETAVALMAFFVEHDGQCFAGCCRVKQTVGAEYEGAPLEVGPPEAYEGPDVDHGRFRAIIERVYREGIAQFPAARVYMCNVVQIPGHAEEL